MHRLVIAACLVACGSSPNAEPRPSRRPTPPEETARPESAPSESAPSESATSESAPSGQDEQTTPLPPAIRVSLATQHALEAAARGAVERGEVPGVVVLLGDRSGIAFERAYGLGALEPDARAMEDGARFDLASLTKVFTAVLILRLVQDGRLRLDDDAGDHLPAMAGRSVRDLLLHRAGLPAVDRLGDYAADEEHADFPTYEAPATRRTNIQRILSIEKSAPGSYRYSDLGYIALGELASRVAGVPLEVAMQRWVLDPADCGARFGPVDALPTERAPRRGPDAPMIQGTVHDPRAFRLGGVAGHAGLFARARDVAALLRSLGDDAFLQPAFRDELVQITQVPRQTGAVRRALGFAVDGNVLEHRGFTGTYLRFDPASGAYAIALSHQVHPDGRGDASALRREVAAAFDAREMVPPPRDGLLLGIDVLRREDYATLEGKRVGLLTHDAAVARDGRTTRELLVNGPVDVRVLFSPEHGFASNREGEIADGEANGIPVVSLFGSRRDPPEDVMASLDAIVVDVQDVGARFYTYFATMHRLMRAASNRVAIVVLDRPNPLGRAVVGPLSSTESFINHHPLPVLHGLTAGEMATLIAAETSLDAPVVVEMEGYEGGPWEGTGLRWLPPSPNLPNMDAVRLYPGVALVEGANVAVGRGTDAPFRLVGAPWADERLVHTARAAGLGAESARFRPRSSRHRGRWCRGVRLARNGATPEAIVAFGFSLLGVLEQYPPFDGGRAAGIVANPTVLAAARAGEPLDYAADEQAFRTRRSRHLRY